MKPWTKAAATACLAAAAQIGAATTPPDAAEVRDAIRKLPWQHGPAQGVVGDKAALAVPAEALLLPDANGARFLELTGNLPVPGHSILVRGDWWATLSFNSSGYIKDDDKLDADALLQALKENDDESNAQRRKLGITQLRTEGWAVPPHYDLDTKYLEWGLRLRADDAPGEVINYTVRLLGRTGYESVVLVSKPETLQHDVAELKTALEGFSFNAGEKYAEFKPGDHVAEFGLEALVLGGAAAAAVKSGLWKTALVALAASWKLVAAAAVALAAGAGRFFRRDKAR